ncbi:iron complex transport system substrate-binding protein [Cryobacterium mesophilum]|uniref:Iron-siderophore ABC transporter substrate-binding protein n=1 Tax=Terrimesophilobacter mesophilus TaxID=433647 RepID=A0A4R8VD02_9MICO|nr:iron-siderophore ABC transporter substrate-binding protein [Terrimesophilobacter mesophilus]MBB5633654.1 iron complex transport system substrate-binding protein [Terrimesophilobacter mesophilus]TFB80346.1 iron-siderophore ABC transporter substrate-binding protein [Terrimesophilobacter mesophilus]
MRSRLLPLVATAIAAALALSGCGVTEEPDDGAQTSADTITITDARGVDVELDGPASRVVGTEWNVLEHLVSLGVMPVGAADVDGYTAWVSAESLSDDVTDIGVRGEPSVETIASLKPDLVVATTDLPEAAIAQLEEFVPVLVVRSADASRPIEQMYDNVNLIARATGTETEAKALLAEYEKDVAEGAAALSAAGLTGEPVAFADGWVASNQVSIRPCVSGSLIAAVNESLGLTTPWTLEGDPDYGLASTDVEGLTALGDVTFVYITNGTAETDPFTTGLAGNAIWESLPFVTAGNVHRLPDGIWMFGGPSSMEQYIDALVAALTD